jgi:hypothetical protein
LAVPLEVDARARAVMSTRPVGAGRYVASAGLAGSAVIFEARQPTLLANLRLPALS